MKSKAPTKLLTIKLRKHLKEMGIRCTVKDFAYSLQCMKELNPGKTVCEICHECAEIAHRLGVPA